MKPLLRYITRNKGPVAFGTALGVEGSLRAVSDGKFLNNTDFKCVVEHGKETCKWVVTVIFSPVGGNFHTAVVFGNTDGTPYAEFEDAYGLCLSLCTALHMQEVEVEAVHAFIRDRSTSVMQWSDEVLEGEDIPKDRILH